MLALATELRARGHAVLLAAPERFGAWVRGHGPEFVAIGVDPEEMLAVEKSPRKLRALVRSDAARQFEVLGSAARGSHLVVGAGVVLAASSIAELLRVPFVGAVFAPHTLVSAEHPFPAVSSMTLPRWVNRLTWSLGARVYGWLTLPLLNQHRRALGLAPHTSPTQHMFGDDVLLASERLLGAAPADAQMAVETTGAWLLRGAPLPRELEHFLAAGAPPVFVGFGSNRDPQRDQTVREIVAGLRLAGARGVISAPAPASGVDEENLHFVESVDYQRLFPRCALVVHHGGAGTTITAALAGKPQWIVAHRGDQHYWAHRVKVLGLGPEPTIRKRFGPAALAAAIRQAAEDRETTARCEALAPRITADGARRAAAALERRALRGTASEEYA